MSERDPLLPWLIFTGLSLFAVILLWYFGLIQRMIDSDRTTISPIICLLYVFSSVHCLWRILIVSREGSNAQKAGEAVVRDGIGAPVGTGHRAGWPGHDRWCVSADARSPHRHERARGRSFAR